MLEVAIRKGSPPEKLRREYLDGLPYAQEFFVESLIQKADVCELFVDSKLVGYALVADESVVEYYLADNQHSLANAGLQKIIDLLDVKRTVCKSFDIFFLNACQSLNWKMKPIAYMFREAAKSACTPSSINSKQASESHMAEVLSLHDGFFDSEEEIKSYLEEDSRLFIYYDTDRAMGCGIIKRIVPWMNDYDIGMVVAPTHRQKGYATKIVNHLINYCESVGWTPVAGCSTNNMPSFRTLLKAGFASHHKLLEFKR